MLPPALGGLRVCVPPVPGHPAPRSMSKITNLGDCPLGTPQLYQKSARVVGEFSGSFALAVVLTRSGAWVSIIVN